MKSEGVTPGSPIDLEPGHPVGADRIREIVRHFSEQGKLGSGRRSPGRHALDRQDEAVGCPPGARRLTKAIGPQDLRWGRGLSPIRRQSKRPATTRCSVDTETKPMESKLFEARAPPDRKGGGADLVGAGLEPGKGRCVRHSA